MHPNHVDLYAGLYGLALVPDSFDLGHGAAISRIYAHFMAPFMMAFAPAPHGKHHPGPWKAAKGGIYIDITAELFLPATTSIQRLDKKSEAGHSRSKAAHGSGEADLTPYAETYAIARRVLLKMIEARHLPDKKELEAGLFGDPVAISPGPPSEQ